MSTVGMSGIKVNDYGNQYLNKDKAKTAVAEKTNFQDNVVHVDNLGNFTKDDFIFAAKNAKDGVMFVQNDRGDIYQIDIKANQQFIDEALGKLDKKENFTLKIDLPSDCIPGKDATEYLKTGNLADGKDTMKELESMGVNLKDGLDQGEADKIINQLKYEGASQTDIDNVTGQINKEIGKFKRVGEDGKEKVSQELKINSPDAENISYSVDEKSKGRLKLNIDADIKLPGLDVDIKKEGRFGIKKVEDGHFNVAINKEGKFGITKTQDGKFDVNITKEGKFGITKTQDGKFDVGLGVKIKRGEDIVIPIRSSEKIEEKMNLGDGKNLKNDLKKLGINIDNGINDKELAKITGKLKAEGFDDKQIENFIKTKLDPILKPEHKLITPSANLENIGPSQELKDLIGKTRLAAKNEEVNIINKNEANAIKTQIQNDISGLKSEAEVKAYMNNLSTFFSSEDGLNVNTNVEFTYSVVDQSSDINNATKYSFDISGKTTEITPGYKETDKITKNFSVTDHFNRAKTDANNGNDPQFSVLAEKYDTKNGTDGFMKFDAKGDIQGIYDGYVKFGGENSTVKLADLPKGVPTNIKDVITQDFKRYAVNPDSELTKVFPMNENGSFDDAVVSNFVESLKSEPGNENNTNITPDKAKELLNYIHTGTNTKGETNVQELQVLLNSMTGSTGKDISNRNHELEGDNQYGYATTLQVRSLGAMMHVEPGKVIPPGTKEVTVEASGEGSKLDKYNTTTDGDDPKTKEREIRIPTINISFDPHADIQLPKFKVEVPKFGVDVDVKLPKFKVETPKIDVDVDVKLPKFEATKPKYDIDVTGTKGKFDIDVDLGRKKSKDTFSGDLKLTPDVEINNSVEIKPEYPSWKFDLNQKYENDWITNDENLFDKDKTKNATEALDAGYTIKIQVNGDKNHLTDAGLTAPIEKLKEKPAGVPDGYSSYFKDQNDNVIARKKGGEIDVFNKDGNLMKSFDTDVLLKQRASTIEASSDSKTITITSSASISPSTGTLGSEEGVPGKFKPSFQKGTVDNDKLALGRGAEMAKDMIESVFNASGLTKDAFIAKYGDREIEFVPDTQVTFPGDFPKKITVSELMGMYGIGG